MSKNCCSAFIFPLGLRVVGYIPVSGYILLAMWCCNCINFYHVQPVDQQFCQLVWVGTKLYNCITSLII